MFERVGDGDSLEALAWPCTERAAGGGKNNPFDGGALAALQTLEQRVVLAVDGQQPDLIGLCRAGHDLAGYNQDFLVGEGDILASLDGAQRGTQSQGPDQRGDYQLCSRQRCDCDRAFHAGHDFDLVTSQKLLEAGGCFAIGDRHQFGTETANLFGQQFDVSASGHRAHPEAIAKAAHDVEGGHANRPGGTKYRDRLHRHSPRRFAVEPRSESAKRHQGKIVRVEVVAQVKMIGKPGASEFGLIPASALVLALKQPIHSAAYGSADFILAGQQTNQRPCGLAGGAGAASAPGAILVTERTLAPAAVGVLMVLEPLHGALNPRLGHVDADCAQAGERGKSAVNIVDAPAPPPCAVGVLSLSEPGDCAPRHRMV